MSDELKACPFCGGFGKLRTWNSCLRHVCCLKCGATSAKYPDEYDAITAWNRRVVTREKVEQMSQCEQWAGYDMAHVSRKDMVLYLLRAAGFEVAE